jgi:hypothetical protein
VEPDIPPDQLEQAQVKVDQLLKALRESLGLTPDAESALIYRPDAE